MEQRRKLSKSACEKYMQCPASFDYHYNQRIRPIKIGSQLVFGIGIDHALNAILEKSGQSPMEEFLKAFGDTPLGTMIPHPLDYDGELLSEAVKSELLEELRAYGYKGNDVDGLASTLFDKLKSGEKLSENQEKALDLIARYGLEAKAELMLIAYQKQVLPYIEKVHNVQKESGPGVLDATVDWYRIGKIIIDHKTSSKRYPDNAVEFSAQLAMYAAEENITKVAYVVFLKQIQKNREKVCAKCGHNGTGKRHKTCDALVSGVRCDGSWTETIQPEAEIQIVHGEVTPQAMAVAAELQREVQRAVDAKIFPCNVQQCNNQFGKPCIYRDLKWKNDMTGLVKLESKKDKTK
jgi:hypothetical protein